MKLFKSALIGFIAFAAFKTIQVGYFRGMNAVLDNIGMIVGGAFVGGVLVFILAGIWFTATEALDPYAEIREKYPLE